MLTGRGWSEKAARIIATGALFLFILLLIAAALALSRCSSNRAAKSQDRVNDAQGAAYSESANEAVAIAQGANNRERESEDLGRANEEEIRNAQGADAPVNPAARDAGLRSLCRRAAYRDSARCKLLDPTAR